MWDGSSTSSVSWQIGWVEIVAFLSYPNTRCKQVMSTSNMTLLHDCKKHLLFDGKCLGCTRGFWLSCTRGICLGYARGFFSGSPCLPSDLSSSLSYSWPVRYHPHPTPPFCLKYPEVCLTPDLYVIIPTPPHPSLLFEVSWSLSYSWPVCYQPHPTPPL